MTRLAYGIQPVRELLRYPKRAFKLLHDVTLRNPAAIQLVELAQSHHIATEAVPRKVLDKLSSDGVHQGLVARAKDFPYLSLDELIAETDKANENRARLLLAFDQVTDPQNFGAILRTVEVMGGVGALFMERRNAQISPLVGKASSGAIEHLPLAKVVNLSKALAKLKNANFEIVGLAGEGVESLYELPPASRTVLVVGSEGKGLRPLVRKHCDRLAAIPTRGRVESLNASVAVAMAVGWLLRP